MQLIANLPARNIILLVTRRGYLIYINIFLRVNLYQHKKNNLTVRDK
jgi:hypothetical protein